MRRRRRSRSHLCQLHVMIVIDRSSLVTALRSVPFQCRLGHQHRSDLLESNSVESSASVRKVSMEVSETRLFPVVGMPTVLELLSVVAVAVESHGLSG